MVSTAKIFNVVGDGTSWTLLLPLIGINMIYSPENGKLMNWKQKDLFDGKQLTDNILLEGKAMVYFI